MLAPWRSLLSSAIHRNRSQPHSRYFQLATVNLAGHPTNRTVVFRGFLDDQQNQLKIITDIRSAKIQDIEHQPIAEACWYFTKTREQFRLSGQLLLITAQEPNPDLQTARQTTWHNLSDPGRSQFAWSAPAQPLAKESADQSAFQSVCAVEPMDNNIPHPNFCLLLLTPHRVDHLQLRSDPQQRCLYNLQEDQIWTIQAVNP